MSSSLSMSGLVPVEDFEYALSHLHHPSASKETSDKISLHDPHPTSPSPGRSHLDHARSIAGEGHASSNHTNVGRSSQNRHQARRESSASGSPIGFHLPSDVIYQIGKQLFQESHPSSPSWLASLQDKDLYSAASTLTGDNRRTYATLLHLSSTCSSYRALLAPFLWHSIVFQHPKRFGELLALIRRYPAINSSAFLSSTFSEDDMTDRGQRRAVLPFPLQLVKELHVVIPERYPGFDQSVLCELLHLGLKNNLRQIEWHAEELPGASVLSVILPHDPRWSTDSAEGAERMDGRKRTAKRLDVRTIGAENKRLFETMGKLRLDAEIDTEEVVRWTRESQDGEAFPGTGETVADVKDSQSNDQSDSALSTMEGVRSLSIDCKCFWPGHPFLSRLTSLDHLQVKSYDLFLLPPFLPSLLLSLYRPLTSLSLSTSKTSIMHAIHLISAGCFDNLTTLDIYPVTPEAPLPQAIRRCRKTLMTLRLTLDVSGNFANYDTFWKILTGENEQGSTQPSQGINHSDWNSRNEDIGPMETLQTLHVDPMPRQNTAPSFVDFVQRGAPNLSFVNGRRKEGFAPGYELLNPDEITSALYF